MIITQEIDVPKNIYKYGWSSKACLKDCLRIGIVSGHLKVIHNSRCEPFMLSSIRPLLPHVLLASLLWVRFQFKLLLDGYGSLVQDCMISGYCVIFASGASTMQGRLPSPNPWFRRQLRMQKGTRDNGFRTGRSSRERDFPGLENISIPGLDTGNSQKGSIIL